MKHVAQTIGGMEDISIKEIEELTGAKAEKLQEGRVMFDITHQKATELTSTARSLSGVYELLQEIKFASLEDLLSKIATFDIEDPFVVRCRREGEHGFQSTDAEKEIGEVIYLRGHKVDLHNPKTTIIADIIDDKCFLGKDLTEDKDLSKRSYKIRSHSRSINACLAYGALRLAGWTKDKTLLDPNCKDGTIAIEAALWAVDPKQITAIDSKAVNITAAEINAKLAGVHKQIKFADFNNPGTADYIITSTSKLGSILEKAENLLAPDGTILLITQDENPNPNHFKLVNKREARVHQAVYTLHILKR